MDTALLLVFKRLSPAMLLRISAVCKQWNVVAKTEELWLTALAREAKPQPGCSAHQSYVMNYKVYMAYIAERKTNAKKLYIKRRRAQFKQMEYTKRGSTARFRVFPCDL
jgi:hypothetical protein